MRVVFSGIAPGQVIAATAFLPDTMTVGSTAWRARPSGPDHGLARPAAYRCPLLAATEPGGQEENEKKMSAKIYLSTYNFITNIKTLKNDYHKI